MRLGLGHRVGRLASLNAHHGDSSGVEEPDEPIDARVVDAEVGEQDFMHFALCCLLLFDYVPQVLAFATLFDLKRCIRVRIGMFGTTRVVLSCPRAFSIFFYFLFSPRRYSVPPNNYSSPRRACTPTQHVCTWRHLCTSLGSHIFRLECSSTASTRASAGCSRACRVDGRGCATRCLMSCRECSNHAERIRTWLDKERYAPSSAP